MIYVQVSKEKILLWIILKSVENLSFKDFHMNGAEV